MSATTGAAALKSASPTARPARPEPDEATRLALYRSMVELRLFEVKAFDLFLLGLVKGTTHLGTGQEAIAAGFAAAMRPDDYTFCTYRGHDHTIARGVSMAKALGELMGRSGGLLRGKGGSMHLTDVAHGAMGSYAIVGAHLPIACGAAWSAQVRGSGQVATCFFGDGATNIGAFHEALNIAAVWKLPVVFVCENNLYMEYTPIPAVTAVAAPGGRPGRRPTASTASSSTATTWTRSTRSRSGHRRPARAGDGPSLVEAAHLPPRRATPGPTRQVPAPTRRSRPGCARDPAPSTGPAPRRPGLARATARRRSSAERWPRSTRPPSAAQRDAARRTLARRRARPRGRMEAAAWRN